MRFSDIKRSLFDPLLWLYNGTLILLAPLLVALKALRYLHRRRNWEFNIQRWTCPVITQPTLNNEGILESAPSSGSHCPPHIVIVATGFGEVSIAQQLTVSLLEQRPDVKITWAIRDNDAVAKALSVYPQQGISIMPYDFFIPVHLWIRRLSPDVIVLVEKFWFPNIVRCSANSGIKVIAVNARTRAHNSLRYRLSGFFYRWIMEAFTLLCFQSDQDINRAKPVLPAGAEDTGRARITGNVKFDIRLPDEHPNKELQAWLSTRGDKALFIAGSISGQEEAEFILKAFCRVLDKMDCSLLLAPRRLHKVDEVVAVINSFNMGANLRSKFASRKTPQSNRKNEIFVLDTLGELFTAYKFGAAAFVGGTLNQSGHNIAEPICYGLPVSYGPSRGFFEAMQIACEKAGIGFRVHTPEQLAEHWIHILENAELQDQLRQRALQLLEEQRGAMSCNVKAIVEQLNST